MKIHVRIRAVALLGLFAVVSAMLIEANASPAHASTPQDAGYVAAIGKRSPGQTDPWGMASYYCTSYAAYRVNKAGTSWHSDGRYDAYQWDDRAREKGIPVSKTPQKGDVAVWEKATWNDNHGHVAYVESVNADGSANVSEYNFTYGFGYDTRHGVRTEEYIHFKDLSAGKWNGVGSARFLGSDRLTSGQRLNANEYILSRNGQDALVMQNDGNLVLYGHGRAVWNSKTAGHSGAYLVVQGDGNIVIYDRSGKALWNTRTVGTGVNRLVMQDDGNLVAYTGSSQAKWASNTVRNPHLTFQGSDRLVTGQILRAGQYIQSKDKRYTLLVQTDGNLVLYGPGYHVLWSAGVGGQGSADSFLGMQSDGNVVLYKYRGGRALWASNTVGTGVTRLVMQTDGNLVAYTASGQAKWASKTAGKI